MLQMSVRVKVRKLGKKGFQGYNGTEPELISDNRCSVLSKFIPYGIRDKFNINE